MKHPVVLILILFALNQTIAQSISIISEKYNLEYLNYPKVDYTLTNFEILNIGLPCIPMVNGIFSPGTGWLMKPTANYFINAITKTQEDNSIYLIGSTRDSMFILREFPKIEKKETMKIAVIPYGYYNMVSFGTDSIFFWGLKDSTWHISYYNGREIRTILSQKEPVTNVIPLSKNTFAYSTTKDIILVQPDTIPIRILNSEIPIESFVFGKDGFLYLSLSNGIFRTNKMTPAQPVVWGIHGLLKSYNNYIFVLWQEKNQVVVLKPK
ncbi:MAG: hypothetical protein NTX61_01675 [Bacteroidetes bacterium]|nr:hypothetical protein [Bacteroidota bacterium]